MKWSKSKCEEQTLGQIECPRDRPTPGDPHPQPRTRLCVDCSVFPRQRVIVIIHDRGTTQLHQRQRHQRQQHQRQQNFIARKQYYSGMRVQRKHGSLKPQMVCTACPTMLCTHEGQCGGSGCRERRKAVRTLCYLHPGQEK